MLIGAKTGETFLFPLTLNHVFRGQKRRKYNYYHKIALTFITKTRWDFMPTTQEHVRQFLSSFKKAAETNLYVPNRDKNRDFLARHGFTVRERRNVLLGLRVEDYSKGPELDDRFPHGPKNVWVFGANHAELLIYIKVKLVEEVQINRALCISFHDAEFRMRFPFRG